MSKRKTRLITVGIIAIGLVIAGMILFKQADKPVSGKVVVSNSPVHSGYTINLTPTKIIGRYIAFDYPKGMMELPQEANSGQIIETHSFKAQDVSTWLLGVQVSMPKGGTLSGNTGFVYRQENPQMYQESQQSVNGQNVIVMTDKTEPFSKVAYIMDGALLATVSLEGYDQLGAQPLQTAFDMVVNSLAWLN